MNPEDYAFLAELLRKESGLSLGEGKEYLITGRLNPIAASLGLTDLEGLIQRLRFRPDRSLVQTVCEAMTTNESMFFRDGKPFDNLRETLLPALIQARRHVRRLRIWCAACSTGQEPYSIAMLIKADVPQLGGWNIEILGTDISSKALERARAGRYTQFEVQRGLPVQMLVRFFKQEGREWVIAPEIREMATFREFNLLQPYNEFGDFDLIFCRNVLIYFDAPTKSGVLRRLARALNTEGYLLLGSAETVLGLSDEFELAAKGISAYRKRRPSPLVAAPAPRSVA